MYKHIIVFKLKITGLLLNNNYKLKYIGICF